MKIYLSLEKSVMNDLAGDKDDLLFTLWNIKNIGATYTSHSEKFVNTDLKTFRCWGFINTSGYGGWLESNNVNKHIDEFFYKMIDILKKNSLIFTVQDGCILFSEESYFWLTLKCSKELLILE